MSSESLIENDGYDHSILGESQVMMIQFGVGLLLFMTYYAVFLVIDRNHPSLQKIANTSTSTNKSTLSLRAKSTGDRGSISTISSSTSSSSTSTPSISHKNSSKNDANNNNKSVLIPSVSSSTSCTTNTDDTDNRAKHRKTPVIKTNKVSSRSFSFGRKRRAKSVQNINDSSISNTNSRENSCSFQSMYNDEGSPPKMALTPATMSMSPSIGSLNGDSATSQINLSENKKSKRKHKHKHRSNKRNKSENRKSNDMQFPSTNDVLRTSSNASNASNASSVTSNASRISNKSSKSNKSCKSSKSSKSRKQQQEQEENGDVDQPPPLISYGSTPNSSPIPTTPSSNKKKRKKNGYYEENNHWNGNGHKKQKKRNKKKSEKVSMDIMNSSNSPNTMNTNTISPKSKSHKKSKSMSSTTTTTTTMNGNGNGTDYKNEDKNESKNGCKSKRKKPPIQTIQIINSKKQQQQNQWRKKDIMNNNNNNNNNGGENNNGKPMRPPLPRNNSFGSISTSTTSGLKLNDGSNDGSNSNDGLYDFVSSTTASTQFTISPITNTSSSNTLNTDCILTQDKLDHHQEKLMNKKTKNKNKHKNKNKNKHKNKHNKKGTNNINNNNINNNNKHKKAIRAPIAMQSNKFDQLFPNFKDQRETRDGSTDFDKCDNVESEDIEDATGSTSEFVHVEYDDIFGGDDEKMMNNNDDDKKRKAEENNNNLSIDIKKVEEYRVNEEDEKINSINSKFHKVFDEYKQQQHQQQLGGSSSIYDDDQKLDPKAPAYIPDSSTSPWSLNNGNSLCLSSLKMPFVQLLSYQSSNGSIATTPNTKLQPVPENDDVDNNSNASTQSTHHSTTTNTTNSSNHSQTNTLNNNNNNNGYITTNIIQSNQLPLHTPKDFNIPSSQTTAIQQQQQQQQQQLLFSTQFAMPPPTLAEIQQIQQMQPIQHIQQIGVGEGIQIQPTLQRTNSMPELLSNPPPHPSQFSRSFNQLPLTPNNNSLYKPNTSYFAGNGMSIPLLPNILDQNHIALQLRNAVNQNIINANNNILQQQPMTPQTPPVLVTPPPNNNNKDNNTDNNNDNNTDNTDNNGQQQQPAQQIMIGSQPTISATPTLINVADGVIPGVEAGLYWYHPQIDQSAVLLPVVVNDSQHQQQQALYASYQNALQQIAIQQQLQQQQQ